MAVKASASITISFLVDVKAVYRYYKLQASTAAKPSKPAAFPPSGGWTDAEPGYSGGSTNTLYLVDCTVFANDTFAYSEVSISSSYEAAKEAYNKAQNVQDQLEDAVDDIQQVIVNQSTDIIKNSESIIMQALTDYVQTGDLDDYKATIQSQLSLLSNQLELKFSQTTEAINGVADDTNTKFNAYSKYFRFTSDGLEIGKDENSLKLTLDNDKIQFTKNGDPVGWWDGTDFHTGNIVVEVNERAQFGNFAFVPRSDGSLMFLKVK